MFGSDEAEGLLAEALVERKDGGDFGRPHTHPLLGLYQQFLPFHAINVRLNSITCTNFRDPQFSRADPAPAGSALDLRRVKRIACMKKKITPLRRPLEGSFSELRTEAVLGHNVRLPGECGLSRPVCWARGEVETDPAVGPAPRELRF